MWDIKKQRQPKNYIPTSFFWDCHTSKYISLVKANQVTQNILFALLKIIQTRIKSFKVA